MLPNDESHKGEVHACYLNNLDEDIQARLSSLPCMRTLRNVGETAGEYPRKDIESLAAYRLVLVRGTKAIVPRTCAFA
jgi:hypothetical protein